MRLTILYLNTLFICLSLSVFSLSAQEEAEQMSAYEFKALESSKKYKELVSQLPETRMRPYRLDGNIYEKLLEAIEDEVELLALGDVNQTYRVNNPLLNTTLDGLFMSGALKNQRFFRFDLVNTSYTEKHTDFFEFGGLFLLNEELNWQNATPSMFNRMIISEYSREFSKENGQAALSMIQIRLSDHAVFTLIDYNGSDQLQQLKDDLRGINFSELMSIAEHLKDFNAEKQKFVAYMLDEWDANDLDGYWSAINNMDFSFSANNDGNEMKFGYACDGVSTILEERDYYPYEIKYKKSSGEVKEEEIEGVNYYYYPKTNGQSMLFAYDGKSFVNLAIESTEGPSALVKSRINRFFKLPIDCDQYKDFKEDIKVLHQRAKEDAPLMKDIERSMTIDMNVSRELNSERYKALQQSMSTIPKTEGIEPLTEETTLKEDFIKAIEPIKEQIQYEPVESDKIKTGGFIMNGAIELPAQVLNTELKLEGKGSNASLSLALVNESFKDYFSYPFMAMSPLQLSQDAFLVQAYMQDQLTFAKVEGFPAVQTEVRFLGGSNALAVFISENAVLLMMGIKENYSQEEFIELFKKMDKESLVALAEKHKNANEDYWRIVKSIPEKIFESELTVVANQKKSLKSFDINKESANVLVVGYDHPGKLLEGGHYFYVVDCPEEGASTLKDEWAVKAEENGYEEKSEGKYTIYSYQTKFSYVEGMKISVIFHKDSPNKHIIHTVERPWTKKELSDYFDDFFEVEANCEVF